MKAKDGLFRPRSLPEALDLLISIPEARLLAGGASLVAMINARIIEPAALVSLTAIPELHGISVAPTGQIVIGALTRHCVVAEDPHLADTLAVVGDAARQIASAAIRNMGTIGGALAHADPGLDFPPALVAARATIEIAATTGRRNVPISEFFVDWFTTSLKAGEIVVAVHLPNPKPGVGLYLKHARVSGDFSIASIALTLACDGEVHVAIGGCGPNPLGSVEVDQILSSSKTDAALKQAGEILLSLADPVDDVRGTAEYRRMLIPRMLRRAIYEAAARSAG